MSELDRTRAKSARVALARVAHQVITLDSGVAPARGLSRWVTFDGREPITGVVASEDGRGNVELDLHLVVEWPPSPLGGQAEKLRAELRREARRVGLETRLGDITVSFHDLALPATDRGPEP